MITFTWARALPRLGSALLTCGLVVASTSRALAGVEGEALPLLETSQETKVAEPGPEDPKHPRNVAERARERWNQLSDEERELMRERFRQLRNMSPEIQRELRERSERLQTRSKALRESLSDEQRRQIAALDPRVADEILEQYFRSVARERGRFLRHHLPDDFINELIAAPPEARPALLHQFHEQRRLEFESEKLIELQETLGLEAHEIEALRQLPAPEREMAMGELRRDLIRTTVAQRGLPADLDEEEWLELDALPTEEFMRTWYSRHQGRRKSFWGCFRGSSDREHGAPCPPECEQAATGEEHRHHPFGRPQQDREGRPQGPHSPDENPAEGRRGPALIGRDPGSGPGWFTSGAWSDRKPKGPRGKHKMHPGSPMLDRGPHGTGGPPPHSPSGRDKIAAVGLLMEAHYEYLHRPGVVDQLVELSQPRLEDLIEFAELDPRSREEKAAGKVQARLIEYLEQADLGGGDLGGSDLDENTALESLRSLPAHEFVEGMRLLCERISENLPQSKGRGPRGHRPNPNRLRERLRGFTEVLRAR